MAAPQDYLPCSRPRPRSERAAGPADQRAWYGGTGATSQMPPGRSRVNLAQAAMLGDATTPARPDAWTGGAEVGSMQTLGDGDELGRAERGVRVCVRLDGEQLPVLGPFDL